MHVSSEHPYFFVNYIKIFYVYNLSHLLKSARNNFFLYQLEFLNDLTDKIYLNKLYKADQGINRCVPKFTDTYKYPGPFQKMKV